MRFRPIVMTTFAAILGSLLLALGLGTGMSKSLGISVVGGLIVSQLLTLFTTPVVYLCLHSVRPRRPFPAERNLSGQAPQSA